MSCFSTDNTTVCFFHCFLRSKDGLLFYTGNYQGAHLVSFLSNEHVNVSLNMVGMSETSTSVTSVGRYSDGLWHDIKVTRTGSDVQLQVDGSNINLKFTSSGE